jgi:hypothetical protein
MGKDKSLIYSNVKRLANEMRKYGCENVIVMCGTSDRSNLFDEECVVDSAETLAESLFDLISDIEGGVQIAPCDAYLADAELFGLINGVPLDDNEIRQPLLAKIDSNKELIRDVKVTEMFRNIPSCKGGIKARNTNTPEQFKAIQSLLQQEDL